MNDYRRAEYEILRKLTPEQKLATMRGMLQQAFELKAAWVRATHPDLGEEEVISRARELVVGGPS